MCPERGSALVVTLLALGCFSTLALGLALSAAIGRDVATNHEESIELANACDSALELATADLGQLADWNEVLQGNLTSSLTDGVPGQRRTGGTSFDLVALTNQLTCGRASWCTTAQLGVFTVERPWGANNPRWRLFLHTPLPPIPGVPRPSGRPYVVVWLGDDAREIDDDPERDGAGAGREGRYVVRARVEAFGDRGGRRVIEAELRRVCSGEADAEVCLPGVRVQSWRSLGTSVP